MAEKFCYRFPVPRPGQVLGLFGSNGRGRLTALKVLDGKLKLNLVHFNNPPGWVKILKYFRGSEIQNYFTRFLKDNLKALTKPQNVDFISKKVHRSVGQVLGQKDERSTKFDLCNDLDLNQIEEREIEKFSGGELQRFAIAVVAIQNAEIYMFEEPSSYLDVRQRPKAAKVKVCGSVMKHSRLRYQFDILGCNPPIQFLSQKIIPSQNSVRHFLDLKIGDSCMRPRFMSGVMKPLQIEQLMDQEVVNLSCGGTAMSCTLPLTWEGNFYFILFINMHCSIADCASCAGRTYGAEVESDISNWGNLAGQTSVEEVESDISNWGKFGDVFSSVSCMLMRSRARLKPEGVVLDVEYMATGGGNALEGLQTAQWMDVGLLKGYALPKLKQLKAKSF
ncbi:hypothetical protein GIB67_038763 [Kingdonia uniflora]|uniref:ABC transporter domain-containing protein n=1 Tax=Kingdonia uniflora TaxID=39325 RepID=A0A7J7NT56_9MAGN|nr:hypothetical protein GIB67_038763 [Kingdonia uniflora]